METLLRPFLARFKPHILPLPKSLLKFYHPSFSPQSHIATFPNSNRYYCQIIPLHTDNYLSQLQNIQRRIQYNKCLSLAEFKGFSIEHSEGKTLSGRKSTKLYIYYEMGVMTFRGVFKSYASKQQGFWRIFFPLVKALAFLEKQKIPHRNLNCYNIILTESHEIKLIYNIGQPTSIDLFNNDSKNSDWEYLFLSPEEMQCYTNEELYNPFKSDVFNLAVIFLTHLLPSKEGEYGDEHYLDKQLSLLKQRYSYCLCNVLCRMLDMDWESRPVWFQLKLMLDEMEKEVEEEELDRSRLYSDIAPRMTRDLLSMVDLKETRRTAVSEFL